MRQDQPSTVTGSNNFFKVVLDNIKILKKATMNKYCQSIDTFKTILDGLQQHNLFTKVQSVRYSMSDFIDENLQESIDARGMYLPQLLAKPMPPLPDTASSKELPKPHPQQRKIDCYIALIIDVLNNKLAENPYEKVCDKENVTEKQHALQAGKIALLMGLPADLVIALLLHDIARPTSNPEHGHVNHCSEGSTILKPFGLSVDFAGLHAFAKYLLYHFCPDYRQLISQTSQYTLQIQSTNLSEQVASLEGLGSQELAKTLYIIMYMRLIDDMSKVPEFELKKHCNTETVEYMDNQTIENMLHKQINCHLAKCDSKKLELFDEQLNQGLRLMLRASSSSNHAELYEKYTDILEPLHDSVECTM